MGRRVGRLPDTVVRPGDHRLVDDCHGCNGALVTRQRLLRFREGLPHVQLVIHGPIIQVGFARSVVTVRQRICCRRPQ